jgi:hypothetical protein
MHRKKVDDISHNIKIQTVFADTLELLLSDKSLCDFGKCPSRRLQLYVACENPLNL